MVRHGVSEKLFDFIDKKSGKRYSKNTFLNVYKEMFLQICREYCGIGDFRKLKASEIRFFYEGMREELKEATKPKR